jgi:hypothetical protein
MLVLRTVKITFVYGNRAEWRTCEDVMHRVRFLALSGLMFGSIGSIEVQLEEKVEVTPVTSIVQPVLHDRVFEELLDLGFKWGLGKERGCFVPLKIPECLRRTDEFVVDGELLAQDTSTRLEGHTNDDDRIKDAEHARFCEDFKFIADFVAF